jgi:cation:H+ antiporter
VLHLVLLLGSAVAIYLACEWFVNAVEWLGVRLKVGPLAVGTVLAAVGTALPESVVTFVAVVLGHDKTHDDLGVGAAMGGPLVLATVAYAVVGAVLLLRRRRVVVMAGAGADAPEVAVPTHHLLRDQQWFVTVFVVKVSLGLVAFAFKPWLGLGFFAVYAVYTYRELSADGEHDAVDLEPLRFAPNHVVPPLVPVLLQTAATLVVIFVASQVFVGQLTWAGPQLGLSATVTALLLSPIATELPEVMNAVIWVRQGKTHLALANISGAMMIQATVPSGLGLLFTPWRFDGPLLLSGIATLVAIGYLLLTIRTGRLTSVRLLAAGAVYLGFAGGLVVLA